MKNTELLSAINACDYVENTNGIICPDEHVNSMLEFIAVNCGGWYDCGRYEEEGYHYIQHNVKDSVWMREVKKLKK